jgi:fido (protein-threonine AMPylation protein)
MTDLFQEPEDAPQLEPHEREGLLQTWITHRRDLKKAELENIVEGAFRTGHVQRQDFEPFVAG